MIAILKKELWSYFGNWSMDYHRGVFFCFRIIFYFFENDFNILDIGTASLQSFSRFRRGYFCSLFLH